MGVTLVEIVVAFTVRVMVAGLVVRRYLYLARQTGELQLPGATYRRWRWSSLSGRSAGRFIAAR
jgi:hypothetical protein